MANQKLYSKSNNNRCECVFVYLYISVAVLRHGIIYSNGFMDFMVIVPAFYDYQKKFSADFLAGPRHRRRHICTSTCHQIYSVIYFIKCVHKFIGGIKIALHF